MASKRDVPARTILSVQNLLLRGVPREYVEGTLDNYVQDDEVQQFFRRYLENLHDMYDDRVNLCLYGSNGSGKTFLSSLIVKEAYRLRYTSAIATLAHLMDLTFKSVKTQGDLSELVMYERADYLVIDEVGKENFTKTGSNVNLLEEILRRAVTNGQVVILCTNLPLEGDKGLYKQYGTSIKSLISGSFVKLEFDSDDYRPIQQKKKKALRLLAGEE